MSVKKKLPFIVVIFKLFILFCFGCRNGDDSSVGIYTLKEVKKVQFPMDNETSYRTFFTSTFVDSAGREMLVFLSQEKPSIQLFDIETQRLEKEILLIADGPNGVGSPSGLLLQSMDSIFVISSTHYRVSMINSSGTLIRSYNLLEGENYNENTGMLRPYTTSRPVKCGSKIYFNVAPDRDVYNPSYFEGATSLVLDLVNGTASYFNTYPLEFKGGVWGVASVNYSTTFNESSELFVYSFAISDSLTVFDLESDLTKRVFAGSKSITADIKPMPVPENSYDLEYALETPYYGGVVYDEYRNVYYRFVRHAISNKDSNGETNEFHEKPISIIILDKDFQRLGEVRLADNVFLDYIYFVSKDGLFVSNGNPENKDLVEDFAVFSCFQLEKL